MVERLMKVMMTLIHLSHYDRRILVGVMHLHLPITLQWKLKI